MSLIDKIWKKKEDVEPEPMDESFEKELPEDLEQFRMPRAIQQAPPREFTSARFPEREPERAEPRRDIDKLDMIIQKLETIDARLKLLEERLSR